MSVGFGKHNNSNNNQKSQQLLRKTKDSVAQIILKTDA